MNIQGQCHFLTLVQGHLHMKIKTCFSQKQLVSDTTQCPEKRMSSASCKFTGVEESKA